MGTEHLKARCICTNDETESAFIDSRGCPIHEKPKPILGGERVDHLSPETRSRLAEVLSGEPEFDVVNKPKHYNSHPSGVECIDIARHLSGDWFNVFKYVFRAEHKNGREDIEKAIFYAKDSLTHGLPMHAPSWGRTPMELTARVIDFEDGYRRTFFMNVMTGDRLWALQNITQILEGYPE